MEELLFCLSLEFKQYLGRRLFQTLTNFSLFKSPSVSYLLFCRNIFRLFDFVGGLRLAVKGDKLFRCDHPSNLRSRGVCFYFKDYLPLVIRPNLTALDECVVCKIQNDSKRFFIIILYHSLSQSIEQFSLFKQRWEEIIININDCFPTIAIYIDDFNARYSE